MANNGITAVAIDKDKHSQWAVKYAVDNLCSSEPFLILIHVRILNQNSSAPLSDDALDKTDAECKELFLPFRGFCARKRVRIKEVVLDDINIAEAIVTYVKNNFITNLVAGASARGFLQSWSKKIDVPTSLTKLSPAFCSVYVVAKGKAVNIKTATLPLPANAHAKQPFSPKGGSPRPENVISENTNTRTNSRTEAVVGRRAIDISPRTPANDRYGNTLRSPSSPISSDSMFTPRSIFSHESIPSSDFSSSSGLRSWDLDSSQEFSNTSHGSSTSMVEAEMRRLKMELKKTMDMYSTACNEAVKAKHKALEFQKWKMDEARKFEDAKLAEEAALALAKMEKARTKAALEAAETSKRLAELEAKRRRDLEKKLLKEEEEKRNVLSALSNGNILYRKYDIEDIKTATNNFSDSRKIGEGGYGPVYKAYLDHTPVAVKVLKSDAAQGMKQFQQEVEVLSSIRHPNMVLLLGASPESGCLVYEYMDNGSLEDRLFRKGGTPPIPWWTRFKISAEIATGLLFLHQTKPEPLVHRDLKPANILLDHNYTSKISDVGLARLVPSNVNDTVTQYHMTAAAGTFCYIDPEYQQTGMLGTKSDVYALGIMLLQIITAKPPMGLAHNMERAIERGAFQDMLDPTVPHWPVEETLAYAKMALKCAELRKRDRPDLGTEILPELNRLKSLAYSERDSLGNVGSAANLSTSSSHRRSPIASRERMKSYPTHGLPRKPHHREFGEGDSYNGKIGFSSDTISSSIEETSSLSDLLPYEEREKFESLVRAYPTKM
ncbi:hypothetical protein ACHQM5_029659 [Ranunculus cassubicifolius]